MSLNKSAGFTSVLFALLGNFLITVIKFIGFLLSGSSALFSESIHSFADTMNQSLLMIGIRKSGKKADYEHSYGYGQERFLWALISACGIFFLGAGVTVFHGITSLSHPESVHLGSAIFLILIASFIIESVTFWIALRDLAKQHPDQKIKHILEYGDPTTIAIVYEDGVALIGVVIAFISIWLTKVTGSLYWDSLGSILIGLMLAVVAVILIKKNRSYLLKKSMPEDIRNEIVEMLEAEPVVERVTDFRSIILDVGIYHVKCEIEFNGAYLLKRMQGNLREEFEEIDGDFEEFKKFAARYVDRVPRLVGNHINKLEDKIQKEYPGISHIDIEIN